MSSILNISYRINGEDEIIFLNEEWTRFALANNAPEFIAENILNRNLWDFIADDTTRELYQKLIEKVRAGHPIDFNFRCDSSDVRRFSEMKITLLENNHIQFDTFLIKTEERVRQNVFHKDVPRSETILIVCSWCKKIEMQNGVWQEIEEAVSVLELFETENLPQLSHGMCLACYEAITEKQQDTFTAKTSTA